MNQKLIKVKTSQGEGFIDEFYVSELGHLMIKIKTSRSNYINCNAGPLKDFLKKIDIEILEDE